eukprot:1230360-Pyramimonas_sp.AAC.1
MGESGTHTFPGCFGRLCVHTFAARDRPLLEPRRRLGTAAGAPRAIFPVSGTPQAPIHWLAQAQAWGHSPHRCPV